MPPLDRDEARFAAFLARLQEHSRSSGVPLDTQKQSLLKILHGLANYAAERVPDEYDTVGELTVAAYRTLDANADRLATLLHDSLDAAGVAHRVQKAGSLLSVFFTTDPEIPIFDYDGVAATETWRFAPFFHALLDGRDTPPRSAAK